MENDPREIELNFNGSSAPADEAKSDAWAEADAGNERDYHEYSGNEESAGDEAVVPMDENGAGNSAFSNANGGDMLRSQQPMNRPAGTLPLVNGQGRERVSAVEMVVTGKSYGTALRLLREHYQFSY